MERGALLFKTLLDYLIAAVALLVSSPLFVLLSVLIKLGSKGPVFYRQTRCGLNGRQFILFKFRTMIQGAENHQES